MPFLSLLFSSRWLYYGLAAAGVAGLLWWGQHTIRTLEAENASLREDLTVARAAAEQNAQAVKQIQADADRAMTAVTDDAKQAEVRTQIVTRNIEVIRHVPIAPSEDVAPVLGAALQCLRLGPAADCAGGSGGKGEGADPAAAAH